MSRLLPSLQPAGTASATVALSPLAPSRLEQCLLLAVLLHILLVLVLGNTPGGTARRGEGVWGALNITLRSDALNAPRPGPGTGLPAPPEQHSGPTGEARQRRYGGAVRAAAAPADAEPGAARFGQWQRHTAEPSAVPAALQPLDSPSLATPEPAPAAPTAPLALPEPTPLVRPTLSAALDQLPAQQAETETLPALPALRARPRAAVRPPSVSGATVPAPEALPALPAFEAPPLPTAALPALPEPSPATPVQALPQLSPSTRLDAPDLPAAPSAPAVPQPERSPAPAVEPVSVSPSTPDPSPRASPTPPATTAGSAAPSAAAPPGPLPAGSPDAGARQGHDVATPASTPPNAPRLNLNLPLTRGGEVSSRGSRGVLPLVPHPPELKSKLSESIEKAAKSDCRQAYQEMGLLAALPLAADAARNKGCRW